MKAWKKGDRVRVKKDYHESEAGRVGSVIGASLERKGHVMWVPVLWDDEDDPDWFKSGALEEEPPAVEHHVTVRVRSPKAFLEVMSAVLAGAREKVGGACEAWGFDPKKQAEERATLIDERNAAQAECHRLRCEQERRELGGEPLGQQIDRLAAVIMAEIPGEPSESEGAVDVAIRLLRAWRPRANPKRRRR